MKKNKGFTLVELLAVVVILAIIALIAVPIVNNIIYSSQKDTAELAVDKYVEAVEIALSDRNLQSKEYLTSCDIIPDGSGDLLCDNNEKLDVEIKGMIPASGKLTIKKLDVVKIDGINFDGFVFSTSENTSEKELVGNYTIRYVNIPNSDKLKSTFARDEKISLSLSKDKYGEYPYSITIEKNEEKLKADKDFTYDNTTGKLNINSMNSNITITGVDKWYTVSYVNLTAGSALNNLPKTAKRHERLTMTLPKDQFNEYPYNVSIKSAGSIIQTGYTYSNQTGVLTINDPVGLLEITGVDRYYTVSYINVANSSSLPTSAKRNADFTISGKIPNPNVTVIMGSTTLTSGTHYTFTESTDSLTVKKVTDNLTINGHYQITYHNLDEEIPRTRSVAHGYTINVTFPVDEDGLHPYNVTVKKDGIVLTSGYTYSYATGVFRMENVTGNIDITGVDKYWDVTWVGVDCASALKTSIKNDAAPTIPISCKPVNVEVKMGNTVLTSTNYTYTASSGDLKFKTVVTDNVTITGYYTVTYKNNGDTQNPASVSPTSVNVKYNTNTTLPTATRTGFTQLGWGTSATQTSELTTQGATYKVTKNVTLYAIWKDTAKPTVTISRTDYNTFKWTASDNVAVTGYAITTTNATPTSWTTTGTLTSGTYDINASTAQTYYVWAKDAIGNINNVASITSYKVTKTQGEGTTLTIKEGSTSLGTTCVLNGTSLTATSAVSTGYRNLKLKKNGTEITSGSSHTINATTTFETTSIRYYNVTYVVPSEINKSSFPTTINKGETLNVQFAKDAYGYYPNITSVKKDGVILTSGYTYSNGLLSISSVDGNIEITTGFTYFKITYNGIGNSSSLSTSVRKGTTIPSFTASPIMPAVRVTMGGSNYTGFSYSNSTGAFTSTTAVTADIVIYGRYTISYSNCVTTSLPTAIDANTNISITMNKDSFGEYPFNVLTTMGGTALSKGNVDTGYTYSNGSYKKNKVTGNLVLTCTDQYYSIGYNYITNSSSLLTSIKRNSNLSITIPAKQPKLDVTMGGTALTSGNADTGYTYSTSTGALVKNKVTGDIVIHGYYNVTYDVAGGSSVSNGTIKGGNSITLPTPTKTGFTFQGWKSSIDSSVKAAASSYSVTGDVKFTAQWEDSAKPTVTLVRNDYNTIGITLKDNVGVTAYAVTTSNSTPTSWTDVTSATSVSKTYDINASTAQTYYVWAKDAVGNVSAYASMTSYTVTKTQGTGTTLTIKEGSTELGTTCVLNGTSLTVTATASSGYTNLKLTKNDAAITSGSANTINATTTFKTEANKTVTVTYTNCPTYTQTATIGGASTSPVVGATFKTQFNKNSYNEYPYGTTATMNGAVLVSGTGYTYSNGLFTLSGTITGNIAITCTDQYFNVSYSYVNGSSSLPTSAKAHSNFTFTHTPQADIAVTMGGTALSKGNADTGFTYASGTFTKNNVTGNLALHGSYTVTYDAAGGSVSSSSSIVKGGNSTTLQTPTRSGFTFQGWKSSLDSSTKSGGASYSVTSDVKFTAQWKDASNPTVTLARNDYNTIGITLKDNVGVVGWAVTTSNTAPTSWTQITSTTSTTKTYDINASTAYTYYVWAVDAVGNVSSAVSMTSYKVTKTQGEGTTLTIKEGDTSLGTTCVLNGTSLTVSGSLSTGYSSLVLKKDSTTISSGSSHTINAATTFTSSATKPVTVTYTGCPAVTETSTKAVGGTFKTQFNKDSYNEYPYSVTATMGGAATSAFTYSNSTGLFTLTGTLTGNLAITCTKQYFTVTYNYINGSSSLPTSVVAHGNLTFTHTAQPKIDTTMGGTSASATYSGGSYTLNNVTGNVVLHGYYTVTYNANGGSVSSPSGGSTAVKGGAKAPIPTATKTDSTIQGWFSDTGLSTKWTFGSNTVTSNKTLYAKWDTWTTTWDTASCSVDATRETKSRTEYRSRSITSVYHWYKDTTTSMGTSDCSAETNEYCMNKSNVLYYNYSKRSTTSQTNNTTAPSGYTICNGSTTYCTYGTNPTWVNNCSSGYNTDCKTYNNNCSSGYNTDCKTWSNTCAAVNGACTARNTACKTYTTYYNWCRYYHTGGNTYVSPCKTSAGVTWYGPECKNTTTNYTATGWTNVSCGNYQKASIGGTSNSSGKNWYYIGSSKPCTAYNNTCTAYNNTCKTWNNKCTAYNNTCKGWTNTCTEYNNTCKGWSNTSTTYFYKDTNYNNNTTKCSGNCLNESSETYYNYTKRLTTTTTNNATAPSGYTKCDGTTTNCVFATNPVVTYGSWSGWTTTAATSSATLGVETRTTCVNRLKAATIN